jgi:hypothetical protein
MPRNPEDPPRAEYHFPMTSIADRRWLQHYRFKTAAIILANDGCGGESTQMRVEDAVALTDQLIAALHR